jgi:hypothetical protein
MSNDKGKIRFGLWYDFRNPAQWRQPADRLYCEILDQIAWGENNGFDDVWLSEHHFIEDGYLPSILPAAAAIGLGRSWRASSERRQPRARCLASLHATRVDALHRWRPQPDSLTEAPKKPAGPSVFAGLSDFPKFRSRVANNRLDFAGRQSVHAEAARDMV